MHAARKIYVATQAPPAAASRLSELKGNPLPPPQAPGIDAAEIPAALLIYAVEGFALGLIAVAILYLGMNFQVLLSSIAG